MQLKKLYLRNFRNYQEEVISFSSGINFIFGENAQGKTNLLEAIFLLATGRSFRTPSLQELILKGKQFFSVQASIEKEKVEMTLSIYFDGTTKKVSYNHTTYSSFTPLLGVFPSVIYTPQDHLLIQGSPSLRRRFLNLLLAQSDPVYVYHLTRFHKALKIRNFLLKQENSSTLFCWEKEMALSSSYLTLARKQLLEKVSLFLTKYEEKLSPEVMNLQVKYHPSLDLRENPSPLTENYLQLLEKNRAKEKILKTTLIGPHRDDFSFLLANHPAKAFASEGQKKLFILCLKLAEWEFLSEKMEAPVPFSMDDVGAHLDPNRLALLLNTLSKIPQVFLTHPETFATFSAFHPLKIEEGKLKQEQTPI